VILKLKPRSCPIKRHRIRSQEKDKRTRGLQGRSRIQGRNKLQGSSKL